MTPDADSAPTFISVRAPLDPVRSALIGLGAVAEQHRSVAFHLGEDLVLLDYDPYEMRTTVALGGANSVQTAAWLARQLEDWNCHVEGILPPTPGGNAA